jgi:threonine dehydrogenase-like Zn-dependent dehydrogenase
MDMPKKLIGVEPRKAALVEYEELPLQPGYIRAKVLHASPKHGSELAAFRGESPLMADYYDKEWTAFLPRTEEKKSPDNTFGEMPLGNQWVGIVTEVGDGVTNYAIGDRVCGYGGISDVQTVKASGGRDLFKMPEGMSWKDAVCYDPAGFALSGVRDAHIRPGDRVAVFGLGAIGLLVLQFAKLAGASYVAAIDPIARRREVALGLGATEVFDPIATPDVGLELRKSTNKLGVDAVVETSANEFALQQAFRGVAYGGIISYMGWARPFRGGMDWSREAHWNNARLIFSRGGSDPNPDHPRWSFARLKQTSWEMLSAGLLNCENIIDPVVPFAESAEAYEHYVDQHPEKSIKLGVTFE